ncbi:MAG: PilZ domain-containing protein [Desulfobacterales bacterium]|jgi:hypothetical protein|nr:PilZ domain-containing protein [Desulfobacterales bacterium]
MGIKENRRQDRHKIGVHATIITTDATIPVYAVDISVNGLRVESSDPILPETVVAVALALNEETLLSGNVLWAIEKTRRGKPYYEIGIEIHAIILEEMEAIGFPKKAALVKEILSRLA